MDCYNHSSGRRHSGGGLMSPWNSSLPAATTSTSEAPPPPAFANCDSSTTSSSSSSSSSSSPVVVQEPILILRKALESPSPPPRQVQFNQLNGTIIDNAQVSSSSSSNHPAEQPPRHQEEGSVAVVAAVPIKSIFEPTMTLSLNGGGLAPPPPRNNEWESKGETRLKDVGADIIIIPGPACKREDSKGFEEEEEKEMSQSTELILASGKESTADGSSPVVPQQLQLDETSESPVSLPVHHEGGGTGGNPVVEHKSLEEIIVSAYNAFLERATSTSQAQTLAREKKKDNPLLPKSNVDPHHYLTATPQEDNCPSTSIPIPATTTTTTNNNNVPEQRFHEIVRNWLPDIPDIQKLLNQQQDPPSDNPTTPSSLFTVHYTCAKCRQGFPSQAELASHSQQCAFNPAELLLESESVDDYITDPEALTATDTEQEDDDDDEATSEYSDSDNDDDDQDYQEPVRKRSNKRPPARRLVINWQWRKGKHVCPICSLNFATRVSLATHHSSHHDLGDNCDDTNEAPHPCGMGSCSAYFLTENQLARHKELFHRIARDSGAPLNPTQVERMALKAAKKHVCPICNLNFATPHTLATHHSSHHDLDNAGESAQVHVCGATNCPAYFLTGHQLARHKEQFHGISRHGANFPAPPLPLEVEALPLKLKKKALKAKAGWRREGAAAAVFPQQRQRLQVGGSQCRVCKIRYYNFGNLRRHYQTSHGVRKEASIHCDVPGCSAYFRTQHQLTHHKTRVHLIFPPRAQQGRPQQPQDDDVVVNNSDSDNNTPKSPGPPFHGTSRHAPLEVEAPLTKKAGKLKAEWQREEEEAVAKVGQRQPLLQVGGSQCRVCKIRYSSISNLRRHYQANHGGVKKATSLHCDVPRCSAYFRTQHQLTHHKSRVHLIIPPRGQSSPSQPQGADDEAVVVNSDNNNTKSGAPPDPVVDPEANVFKCNLPYCTASFASIHQLESHVERLHTRLCKMCGAEFTTNSNLRRHRYGVHKKDLVLRFACGVEDCGREFEYEEEVRWHHDRKHTTLEKLKVVDLTPKVVVEEKKKKKAVKRPQQESANGGVSRKKPRNQNSLEEASLPCHVCGKTYADNFRLKRHLKSHSDRSGGEWAYTCSFCSKKVSSKQTLMEHERTHTGQKFLCGVCGAGYVSKHQMKYHMMKKHPEIIDP